MDRKLLSLMAIPLALTLVIGCMKAPADEKRTVEAEKIETPIRGERGHRRHG